MLRWYWYLCGSAYVKQTSLLCGHEAEDYERWRSALRIPEYGPREGPCISPLALAPTRQTAAGTGSR
jgi:hypothetical protein